MIATICKSCNTVSRVIIERCKWCGSRCLQTKFVDNSKIFPESNGREMLIEPKPMKVKR
jgi:hypothetical protein